MTADNVVALFDLDGVIFDTESQYSRFWNEIGRLYHPEIENFGDIIKGQTLVQIFDKWFKEQDALQQMLVEKLNDFEMNMDYQYIPGVLGFLSELRSCNVRTAVVTSSNLDKMSNVYKVHPEFKANFDRILTSENFKRSKPDPDCYLLGARIFNVHPDHCVVFEDSFNGLRAGNSAGMRVVGLSTTNSEEAISALSDCVIADFTSFTVEKMLDLFSE